jgi:exopolysaccharide production protein ExoY
MRPSFKTKVSDCDALHGNGFELATDIQYEPLVEAKSFAEEALGGKSKRLFDLIMASIIVIIALPLFGLVAVLIRVTDPGPLVYRHVRVGHKGKPFRCLKFRTMVVDSENVLKTLLDEVPEARAEWEETHKLRNDPRITPIGQFLRRSSLDELPQILNVIRGEMSLVGPRPIIQSEMPRYGKHLDVYLSTRPGITGLWQISGRSDSGYSERVAFDQSYLRNWHFTRDIVILLKTLPAILTQRGSY